MSVLLGALLVATASTDASANSGRLAVGLTSASGYSPVEPGWQGAAASAVGCVGVAGWWITGGHDYAGSRGQVLRTPDDLRWGASADLCPTASGGWLGAVGVGYGQQHGGAVYATPSVTVGVAGFAKRGPHGAAYGSLSPYVEPKLALGVALPPGVSLEVGPYLMLAPSLVRAIHGQRPEGMFVGQAGFELTVLVGAASPERPWRARR
jgi:hypothetical protein